MAAQHNSTIQSSQHIYSPESLDGQPEKQALPRYSPKNRTPLALGSVRNRRSKGGLLRVVEILVALEGCCWGKYFEGSNLPHLFQCRVRVKFT